MRGVNCQHHRRAVGWPNHGDIIGGAIIARSGFIADLPVRGHGSADAFVAGRVAAQPFDHLLARNRRKRIVQRESPQTTRHRFGRRSVTRVARNRRVEARLPSVKPELVVARRTRERRDCRWPAQQPNQQVARRVVAVLQRRRAQLRDC